MLCCGVPWCGGVSSWYYAGSENPYYNDSHKAFRAKVRAFVDSEIVPHITEWEEKKEYPRSLHEKAYKAGHTPLPPSLCLYQ